MIKYEVKPRISNDSIDELFANAWKDYLSRDFTCVLKHSLTYICAFDGSLLVGFVNVAWDGGVHGFVLDTTVRQEYQRRGIGTELMRRAAEFSAKRGLEWLHVDFEPHLESFYRKCGYERTEAGLLQLNQAVAT
jgi:GNAT superfamily N-acetyltransferase